MLSRLWQYFTGPVFNAATETSGDGAVTVIAGQTTKICTLKLSLVAEGKFRNPQEDVGFPRPSFNSVPQVTVSYGEDRRPRREELELDVFVNVTSAGKYSVTPEFPEDLYNFRSIDKKTVHFYVKPSELNFVELRSIAPLPNHRNADGDVYRGGMVQVRVAPEDEFGNFTAAEGNPDLSFDIPSCRLSVTLLSVVLDKLDKNFVVKVLCATVGSGHFELVVSQGDRQIKKDVALKVIRPPVSRIILSEGNEIEKRLHEAGEAIAFIRFKFIDILGNPIPSQESIQDREPFRLDPRKTTIYPNWSCDARYTNENDRSLTIRPSEVDPNVCELEFTPSEAGKTMYSLSVAGKVLGSFKISVLPREGDDVKVVHNLQREHQRNYEVREEIPYNTSEYLEFYEWNQQILCLGVKRRHLVGEDYANINNINRVLEKKYPDCKLSKDLVSWVYGWLVVFDLSSFQKNAALKVFALLSDLVKGQHHYRNEANEFAAEREKWDGKEVEAIEKLEEGRMEYKYRIEADRCCKLKLTCGNRMHESNEKASDAIFQFYNHSRPQSEIDLHGQRVGNTEKLKELETKLRRENKTPDEIKRILEQRRQRTDEAIRKLDERVREFDHKEAKRDGEDWLEIIDGAGHHSAKRGEQKIRPKVKEYLEKKNMKYVEANEGALLVTFSEYTGREPCVADFYCTRCTRKWTSTTSWKGLFQRCHRCDAKGIISNCYPFKLRTVTPERKRESTDFTRQDHRRLCQKCMQLGRDCRQR